MSGSKDVDSFPRSSVETDGIPIAPSLPLGERRRTPLEPRTVTISLIAIAIALAATVIARVLVWLIAVVTNLAYFGRLSGAPADPAHHSLGWWAILVPVAGGCIVGAMARYGSTAIRGHGIPEAMEQVLTNGSRIPPRITFLKPVSSAIAIGTGGPFGAEGPIIATGGALGSLVGQLLHTTGVERKTLLSAGAAAGMTAIFGSPLAAVILAVELLLFELRARTLIPVATACAVAACARERLFDNGPVFPMHTIPVIGARGLFFYVVIGLVVGLAAVLVTRLVYGIEDAFEKIPIHWMWWPALGGLVVGIAGHFAPRTLGVGYQNITDVLNGNLTGAAVLVLGVWKLVSWSIALGSGTSGGTLAPLLTIGGALGAVLAGLAPTLGINPGVAALVGMAALFAGASRAFLTSVVFALETTQQPGALLPLLAGCAAAYLVSALLLENTIMTEKIARRGIRVPSEYVADHLDHITAGTIGRKPLVTLRSTQPLGEVRHWLGSHRQAAEHQGYPVLDPVDKLVGVVTRRNLLDQAFGDQQLVSDTITRLPVAIEEAATLRQVADEMVRHGIGRLPLVDATGELTGIVTRSDLLAAHGTRIKEHEHGERSLHLPMAKGRKRG